MTTFYVGLNFELMCQPEMAPCQPSCYLGGQFVYLAVNPVSDWEQTHGSFDRGSEPVPTVEKIKDAWKLE